MADLDSLIEDLVAANRILASEGIVDAFGHVSARHPDHPGRFLLSRARSPELVEASDMMEFTLEGVATAAAPAKPYHRAFYSRRAVSTAFGCSICCPQPQPRPHPIWFNGRKTPPRRAQFRDSRRRSSRVGCTNQFRRHGLARIKHRHGIGSRPCGWFRKLRPDARTWFHRRRQIHPGGRVHIGVFGSER